MPDPTFTDIVAPGAKTALDWAKKSSPAQNCQKVRNARCHLILLLPTSHLEIIFTGFLSPGAETALNWAESRSPPRLARGWSHWPQP